MAGISKADQELLEKARERFRICTDAEDEIRRLALEDMKFAAGDQWPDLIKFQRDAQKRPCLVINRIPQFVHQVTNEQRQNRPSIQINPVDSRGDIKTAEVQQGIVRHIEYDSGADQAYDTAFEHAVIGGFGYIRVATDFTDEMAFTQEIKILRVDNPFTIYMDPGAKEFDRSDADFCFVSESLTRERYEALYGKENNLASMSSWTATGDGWIEKDRVRVFEYFYREMEAHKITLWSDGATYIKGKEPAMQPGVVMVAERDTQIPFVRWARLNAVEVLDKKDWPGRFVPIVPVYGEEKNIDGKRVLKGIVRDARDAQQQYNFMQTAATEAIALAPKAPFIGYAGQFEGFERQWQNMNTLAVPYLQVKPIMVGNQAAPLPQRQQAEPPIQAMNEMISRASDDLKSTTGIYDAALGNRSNEISGKGILARQQQSQSGNFHYIDNLSRSLKQLGRIILELIPVVYDTQRVVRIIGEDGKQETVTVNAKLDANGQLPDGVAQIYDLNTGRYDVTVSTGPSYQTKRQEAVNSMLALVSSYPQLMQIAGDLITGDMDWPGAQELSKRMFRALPPQIAMDSEDLKALPPEAQQMVAALQSQLQQLQQQNQALELDVKTGMSAKHAELESKERIEFAKLDVEKQKIAVEADTALATINARAASDALQRESAMLSQAHDQAHDFAMSQTPPAQPPQQGEVAPVQ